ncbi:MAG: alpha-L-rhamnosidase N-terminal domain-containing protein, partial [Nibricoccus sp.]
EGKPSAWSAPATWTMGLLEEKDWKGIWITPPTTSEAVIMRREFAVKPGLKRAVAHVSGVGIYELGFNGGKAGQDLLAPGWTNFDETILYRTEDVTALLKEGANAATMELGNGMYHVVRRNRFAKFTGSFGPLRGF